MSVLRKRVSIKRVHEWSLLLLIEASLHLLDIHMKRIGVFLRKTNTLVLGQRSYVSLMDSLIQSCPTLIRTPHYYGKFALFIGKIKKALIYSKFNPFNTDTFYGPLRVCINGFSLQCIWSPNLLILYLFFFFSRRCVRASRNAFSGIFPWCEFKCYIRLVFVFLLFTMLLKNGPEPYAKKCIFPLALRFVLKDNYLRELYGS